MANKRKQGNAGWNRALSYLRTGREADARLAVAHSPELLARLQAHLDELELARLNRIARLRELGTGNERLDLAQLEGKRRLFVGTVRAFTRRAPRRILLTEVAVDGRVITDHVWLRVNDDIRAVAPQLGDQLECECIVAQYHKGRGQNFRFDWSLFDARKVRVKQKRNQDGA